MSFIMKTVCPSENITYSKDLLFFPLAFMSSCLRFQSMFDENGRIYLFWCKDFTVNKSPEAGDSRGADGSCRSARVPLQIRSQDVLYHSLKVTREQPAAKNKKAK